MNIADYLATEPLALVISVSLLGLMVGSFLNVVIHRLPIMLERDWCMQCSELLDIPETIKPLIIKIPARQQETFNLAYPASHCPHCGHCITPLENIPILSYLWQRGRCSQCKTAISLRYPLIELLTAVITALVAWHIGFEWQLLGALLLTWALIALTVIDIEHYLLPDNIVLPFLWLGIIFNIFGLYTDLYSSVIGAIAGYMSLWIVFQGFKLLTGKEGMGFGDFKLLAMLGAWLGWQFLPLIILLSSVVGAVIGLLLIYSNKLGRDTPIPFGPYLALAGWASLLWGNELIHFVYYSRI